MVAVESPTVAYVAGGVSGTVGPVSTRLLRVEQFPTGMDVSEVTTRLTARFCGCAMVDTNRRQVVVMGGRNGAFEDAPSAQVVDVETGTVTPLDAGAAVAHPVGCHAVFLPDRDEGYVFGGVGANNGFTGETYRYNPVDRSFTLLPATGPQARYDGILRYPDAGGPVWLVAGMGVNGNSARFFGDVWKFDPAAATWTQVPVTGASPAGRRIPWVVFAPDHSALMMGFGSDSPQGATMKGDLWRLDLATSSWTEVPRDPSSVVPAARGFSPWLPGPAGTAGILSGGLQEDGAATQVLAIHAPVDLTGWH
jgi:hypothetical protein